MTDKTPKTKPSPKQNEEAQMERFFLPRPSQDDTPDTYALKIVKIMWLKQHPDKTEKDFEEQYQKEEAERKAEQDKK